MYGVKRILIVTTDVKFGLSAKKGLERNGQYQVTVFSSGHSAVEHVRLVGGRVEHLVGGVR